jgi:hypothetical protein
MAKEIIGDHVILSFFEVLVIELFVAIVGFKIEIIALCIIYNEFFDFVEVHGTVFYIVQDKVFLSIFSIFNFSKYVAILYV